MGHTLLSLLGFFLLNLLYRGQAQDAVLTIEPNLTTFSPWESVTFKCDITGGKENDWFYSIQRDGQAFLSYQKYESYKLPSASGYSGEYQCFFLHRGSTKISNKIYLNVSERPEPVLTVSPSWPSPGASVTLNCRVDHPSAGWSFYWYKAVPRLSGNSYSYELLPGSKNGTEQDLFIIDGQAHTAIYYCRAGIGYPVYYSSYSKPKFVWSGDINSAASLTVSPDSVQHFTKTSVSLSCEGNSTEWRVMRLYESGFLHHCSSWGTMTGSTCTMTRYWFSGVYWCESETGQFSNAVNITIEYGDIILVSPVRPVAEGLPVTLSCKLNNEAAVYYVDFYKNDKVIQNDTRRELTISAVSKSDEGFYKCKQRDSADGWTSPESWFSVKSASGHGKDSQFPVLLIVGLLCGVLLIILLLLFLYSYRKSKDSCYSRSQRTNHGPATDHMINQDETNQREYASVLQDNACLYETIKGPEEPANDESMDVTYSVVELKHISKKGKKNEPEDCVYSHVQMASAAGKSSPAPADETVYSELKPGTALGKNAAVKVDVCVRDRESVFDVKMGHTLLCALGLFLLNLLYRVQAQDAVLTIEPNWTTVFIGESVTFKCDITGDKDRDWSYSIQRDGREFLSYQKHESFKLPSLASGYSGEYQCFFRYRGSKKRSNKIYLTVSDKPLPVLTVSPSWPSPGASVTLNCRVDHPSAGWSFYWFKAVPKKSDNSYSYELLPGSENGTEHHLFIIDGQTHTAGYVCIAGRGDPVFYTSYTKPTFFWSGDINSVASLTVSPDSVQHFTETSVSLSCEGNSTEWRVMKFSQPDNLLLPCSIWGTMTGSTCTITRRWLSGVFWCESETGQFSNAVNITKDDDDIILVSPVRPVAEGLPATLSCKLKTETVYNADFYKNDKLIQNDTRRELTISAVSKSDEGFYKCKQRDSADGWTSPESWFSVKYRNVILESPASTLFEGESVTLRCRHRNQREENAAFYRDRSLMANNTVQVMSDGSSFSCKFGDEESESIKLRTEPKPKAQLRDVFPGGGNVTLTCSVGPSSASGWRYFWYKKEKTSEPLKTQDVVFLTNDQISVSRGGVYWCRGGRGNPVYYTEYSDAVVTNRAVVTLRPNWPEIYSGETITLTCEIKDGGDYEWDYIWTTLGSYKPPTSDPKYTLTSQSGDYGCMGRLKGEMSATLWSDVLTLTVSNDKPLPVLTVSPSWPSPGASVTLNCRVDHPSAGWSFYWYKAVPKKSGNSYSHELLPGSENGTEHHLFIIDGQTHTAGYVCRAGRGDPVFYSWHSSAAFLWSGDLNSAASLTVSPDSVQHFTETSVSLSCEGNSTEWRVRSFWKPAYLYPCSSWGTMTGSTCTITSSWLSGVFWCESETGQFSNAVNITMEYDGKMILVSPVRPVAEGHAVTLSCKLKTGTVYNVDFYKNDKLIQNDTRSELTISAVSKSDEGFYKCKQRDSADGWMSPESWFSVKSASRPGKVSQFPVLLTVGLLCGVLRIILPLLFMYRYRKSKDSVFIRSQSTNQGPATDHMINQDEIQNMPQYSTLLHGDRCLYETIGAPVEAGNDSVFIRSQSTNQGPATDHMINQDEIQNMPEYSALLHGDRCLYGRIGGPVEAGNDSVFIRSQSTNQGPATDHMINQDEIQNMPEYSALLHGDRCLYGRIGGPVEAGNAGASNEPEESLYINVAADQ
ncbi:uncharacterized protein LOC117498006 [Trematomus bernacchii]|uniref:uncharacterized protein LOC117498006 n=1 Tax=Trematomus bernacchii TaxID=40690 RepID=UPI00146C4601|nr:uncharacterized protein LOC117498006 [Trematomus bernacchii]